MKKHKKSIGVKPLQLQVNEKLVKQAGLESADLNSYFPSYLTERRSFQIGIVEEALVRLVQVCFRGAIWILLRPRRDPVGRLDLTEVTSVYTREAATYDKKHHRTTRGQDLMWRRRAGWFIASHLRGKTIAKTPVVLDLCSGTGLTALEIGRVLQDWYGYNFSFSILGLDYNPEMLAIAKSRTDSFGKGRMTFLRGNAMDMSCFSPHTFDFTTQVFGIGGVSGPSDVFREVLRTLKPGGVYLLIDIHHSIPTQPGEWSFFLWWLRSSLFEAITYYSTTIPVVLNRLWGWRDPTLDFYYLPLTTWQDAEHQWWGFELENFTVEVERWWWGLPVMPIGSISVKKTTITNAEAEKRQAILESIF